MNEINTLVAEKEVDNLLDNSNLNSNAHRVRDCRGNPLFQVVDFRDGNKDWNVKPDPQGNAQIFFMKGSFVEVPQRFAINPAE